MFGDMTGLYEGYFNKNIVFIATGDANLSMYIDYECSGIVEMLAFLSLLWFFLPLFILSLADRTWAWTRRFRKQKSATGQTDGSDSTDKDNNTPVADEG